jgi:thioredoxin 1
MFTFVKKFTMYKLSILILSVVLFASCNNQANKSTEKTEVQTASIVEQPASKPVLLNEEAFKTKVFDFASGKDWKYAGDKPCIIDFYADWCKPCKILSPTMDELAAEYKGQIYFYKVNIDFSQNVSAYFNINSIPAVFFIPMSGEPRTLVGLNPKEEYVNAIQEVLLKKGK